MNFWQLATGGIDNILNTIGKGADYTVSGFFPTAQRDKVISEITAPAGASGMTYRPVQAEMQSLLDLARPKDVGAYPVSQLTQPMPAESKSFFQILSEMTTETRKITTVVDEFLNIWGVEPLFTDKATPRAGYPAGEDVTYWQKLTGMAADVVTAGKSVAGQMLDQVKGLFNLGYEGPANKQPVFTIGHELAGGTKLTMWGIAAIAIIAILLLRGKK